VSDYAEQFNDLTTQQGAAQAAVDRIGAERARVLAAWHAESGLSYAKLGVVVGLKRGTVQQLVERGRDLITSETSSPQRG